MALWGYPALVDNGTAVSLRLLDSPQAARQSQTAGVRRLFLLQMREQVKHVLGSQRDMQPMSLHYATLGNSQDLKAELASLIVDRAFLGEGDPAEMRTRQAFEKRLDEGWNRLSATAEQVVRQVAPLLAEYHAVAWQLSRPAPALWDHALRDLRDQLGRLVSRNFLSVTPGPLAFACAPVSQGDAGATGEADQRGVGPRSPAGRHSRAVVACLDRTGGQPPQAEPARRGVGALPLDAGGIPGLAFCSGTENGGGDLAQADRGATGQGASIEAGRLGWSCPRRILPRRWRRCDG